MSCSDELHLNDEGTLLTFPITECVDGVSTPVNITTATLISIKFLKFNGTTLEVTGVVYTGGKNGDGSDGIVEYITKAGDIDVIGKWKVQIIITFPDGKFSSSINKTIKVLDNL